MHFLDYGVIGLYLAVLLGFGYYFRHQTSREDYFLGGRRIKWFPLTLSTMATQLSAISFVSAPAFVGLRDGGGLVWLTYEFAVPLAMILLLAVVMPALHAAGVVSIYDFLEKRFNQTTRLLLSIVFQISRSFATGILVYTVALILDSTMGIPFWQSIIIVAVITILYSMQGGMSAVVWGDAIQMGIIVLGALMIVIFGLDALGGFQPFVDQLDMDRVVATDYGSFGFDGEGFGVLPMIFGGFVLYASYYGCDQTQAQRTLSARNPGDMRRILMANGLLRFPVTMIYCMAGLVVGTLAATTPSFMEQIPVDNPDRMIPVFILTYLPPGVVGLLLVAILAAAMSSLSSTVNSLAAVTVEDWRRFTGKEMDEDDYLKAARWIGFFWGAVIIGFSLYGGDIAETVIEAINKIGSVFYGPILAVFLLAVGTKRLGALSANVGLIVGVLLNVYFWREVPELFWFWWNFIGAVVTIGTAFIVDALVPSSRTDGESAPLLALSGNGVSGGVRAGKREVYILVCAFIVIVGLSTAMPTIFEALKG